MTEGNVPDDPGDSFSPFGASTIGMCANCGTSAPSAR